MVLTILFNHVLREWISEVMLRQMMQTLMISCTRETSQLDQATSCQLIQEVDLLT